MGMAGGWVGEGGRYCFDPPALFGGALERQRCGGRISQRKNRLSLRWPGAACASLSMQNRLLPWAKRTFHFFYKLPFFFFFWAYINFESGGGTQDESKAQRKTQTGAERKRGADEKHL